VRDEDRTIGATRWGHDPQPWMAHGQPRPLIAASLSKVSIGWYSSRSGEGDGGLFNTLGCEGAEVGYGCRAVPKGHAPAFPPARWVLTVGGAVKGRR
jgi:hypothetical protein